MSTQALLSRIENLERQNKRIKSVLVTMVIFVIMCVCIWAVHEASNEVVCANLTKKPQIIEADKFILRGPNDIVLAQLAITADGPSLIFFNEHGKPATKLSRAALKLKRWPDIPLGTTMSSLSQKQIHDLIFQPEITLRCTGYEAQIKLINGLQSEVELQAKRNLGQLSFMTLTPDPNDHTGHIITLGTDTNASSIPDDYTNQEACLRFALLQGDNKEPRVGTTVGYRRLVEEPNKVKEMHDSAFVLMKSASGRNVELKALDDYLGLSLLGKNGKTLGHLVSNGDRSEVLVSCEEEKAMAALRSDAESSKLHLYYNDEPRATLIADQNQSGMLITGKNRHPKAHIFAGEHSPQVVLLDEKDRPRIFLEVEENGPALRLLDEEPKSRAVVGVTSLENIDDGTVTQLPESSIVVFDKNGKVNWRSP